MIWPCKPVISILLAVLLLCVNYTFAQDGDEQRRVNLVTRAFLSAPPQKVYYFLVREGSLIPIKVAGTFVPTQKLLIPTEGSRDWFLGASIGIDLAKTITSYSVLILSTDGEFSLLPAQGFNWREEYVGNRGIADFKTDISQWKQSLVQVETEGERVEGELRRLQSDAEIIARSQKAIDIELKIQAAKQEMEGIKQDIESLNEVVQLAKQSTPPKNFSRREIELTQQLKALAEATKQAESNEEKRIAQGEVELHNVRSVIEATRFEDPERLRAELLKLRRYRQKLEGKRQDVSDIESAADYLR